MCMCTWGACVWAHTCAFKCVWRTEVVVWNLPDHSSTLSYHADSQLVFFKEKYGKQVTNQMICYLDIKNQKEIYNFFL